MTASTFDPGPRNQRCMDAPPGDLGCSHRICGPGLPPGRVPDPPPTERGTSVPSDKTRSRAQHARTRAGSSTDPPRLPRRPDDCAGSRRRRYGHGQPDHRGRRIDREHPDLHLHDGRRLGQRRRPPPDRRTDRLVGTDHGRGRWSRGNLRRDLPGQPDDRRRRAQHPGFGSTNNCNLGDTVTVTYGTTADSTLGAATFTSSTRTSGTSGALQVIASSPVVTVIAATPTRLAITSISPASPIVGGSFTVTVESQTAGGAAVNVTSATGVSLGLNTGTGTLGGTLTGTIANGTELGHDRRGHLLQGRGRVSS